MILPPHILEKMDAKDRASLGKAGRLQSEIDEKIKERAEKDLHHDISRFLNLLGIVFCHARMDKKSGITVGWPDYAFPYKGLFVAWEAKTGTKLSHDQLSVKHRIVLQGGHYRVITHLGECKDHLREIDELQKPSPIIPKRRK
jgi:hypothetical protein